MKLKCSVIGLVLFLVVGLPVAGFFATLPSQPNHQEGLTLTKAGQPAFRSALPTRWNKTYGGTNNEMANDVVECSSGGFAFTGGIDIPGHATDVWLVRTDVHGNQLWNRSFGGSNLDEGYSLTECSDGGFAITGHRLSGSPWWDLWLIRTNATGHHLWNQTFAGDQGYGDRGYEVIECSGGGFAVIGYTAALKTSSQDMWLIRTDASGNHLWNQTYDYDGGSDYGYAIVECSGGGFALGGAADVELTESLGFWLVRTDADGVHLWNQTYDGDGYEECYDLVECVGGGFALAGYTDSFGAGGSDMWLVRTDATGNHLWNQTFGTTNRDKANGLVECSDGGFALVGYGNYIPVFISRDSCLDRAWAGESDMWLVRTDATGNHQWNQTYGGALRDIGTSIVNCSDGGFLLSGYTKSFGAGSFDGWLVRVAEDNMPPTWVVAPTDQVVITGVAFSYDLDASDPEGLSLDAWWLNDTTNFAVDAQGVITNAIALDVGVYGVRVSVNDTYGNMLTGTFKVTVIDPFPWHLVIFLAIIAILFILLFACLRKYDKV